MDDDLLERTDEIAAPTCHQCGDPLEDSVSEWWCSPLCQQAWTAHQYNVARLTHYREPTSDPEFAPDQSFAFDMGEGLCPDDDESDANYVRYYGTSPPTSTITDSWSALTRWAEHMLQAELGQGAAARRPAP